MTKEIMNAVNTQIFGVWFLIGAALVFWMQAGFAMVEAGFTRAKNAGNIIMKNLMDFCIGTCVFILIGLLIYHITKNQMIAGAVTGVGIIAGVIIYFVKKTLLESLFSTLLGHLVLTDIFYNFSQNYIFDTGGLLTYLSLIVLLVFLTVQTFEKRRWS